jgi:hypothetical protein
MFFDFDEFAEPSSTAPNPKPKTQNPLKTLKLYNARLFIFLRGWVVDGD